MSGLVRHPCSDAEPHLGHSWGVCAGSGFLCPGVTTAAWYRMRNRAKFVGRAASYNGRRVTIIDADDSGCAQIALWVNRDQLEVDCDKEEDRNVAGGDCGHRVGPVSGCAGSRCAGEVASGR